MINELLRVLPLIKAKGAISMIFPSIKLFVSLNPKGYEDAYNGLMQLGGSPVRMRRGGSVEDPDAPKNPAVLFGPGTPASRQSKLDPQEL